MYYVFFGGGGGKKMFYFKILARIFFLTQDLIILAMPTFLCKKTVRFFLVFGQKDFNQSFRFSQTLPALTGRPDEFVKKNRPKC
jgi:hypothetical protein